MYTDENYSYCKLFLSFNLNKIFELIGQNKLIFIINCN